MPSTIYLASGDEFTVTQPYAVALDRWTTRAQAQRLAEFTAIYYRNPKYLQDDDDEDDDGDDPEPPWPAYREALVTVDLTTIIAIERVAGAPAAMIERARRYEAERSDSA